MASRKKKPTLCETKRAARELTTGKRNGRYYEATNKQGVTKRRYCTAGKKKTSRPRKASVSPLVDSLARKVQDREASVSPLVDFLARKVQDLEDVPLVVGALGEFALMLNQFYVDGLLPFDMNPDEKAELDVLIGQGKSRDIVEFLLHLGMESIDEDDGPVYTKTEQLRLVRIGDLARLLAGPYKTKKEHRDVLYEFSRVFMAYCSKWDKWDDFYVLNATIQRNIRNADVPALVNKLDSLYRTNYSTNIKWIGQWSRPSASIKKKETKKKETKKKKTKDTKKKSEKRSEKYNLGTFVQKLVDVTENYQVGLKRFAVKLSSYYLNEDEYNFNDYHDTIKAAVNEGDIKKTLQVMKENLNRMHNETDEETESDDDGEETESDYGGEEPDDGEAEMERLLFAANGPNFTRKERVNFLRDLVDILQIFHDRDDPIDMDHWDKEIDKGTPVQKIFKDMRKDANKG